MRARGSLAQTSPGRVRRAGSARGERLSQPRASRGGARTTGSPLERNGGQDERREVARALCGAAGAERAAVARGRSKRRLGLVVRTYPELIVRDTLRALPLRALGPQLLSRPLPLALRGLPPSKRGPFEAARGAGRQSPAHRHRPGHLAQPAVRPPPCAGHRQQPSGPEQGLSVQQAPRWRQPLHPKGSPLSSKESTLSQRMARTATHMTLHAHLDLRLFT